jgi:hypothetical protein
MKRHVIYVLSFLFAAISCVCQYENQTAAQWKLSVKLIAGGQRVADKSFSTVTYAGIGGGIASVVSYRKNRSLHELEVSLLKGNIKTSTDPVARANQLYSNLDYYYLYTITPEASLTLKAGGNLNLLYAKRKYNDFINNTASRETVASLAGTVELVYDLKSSLPGCVILDRVTVPFISSLSQPRYGDKGSTGSIFNNMQSGSFADFMRVRNRLTIEKSILPGQTISLSYTWDYYQLTTNREVKQAGHQLALMYSVTL